LEYSVPNELEANIRGWLEAQGYPLEMRTAAAFRLAGFRAVQSAYYEDPETSAWREVDVVADIPEITPSARIVIVAECKSSRQKPWLLFTSPKRPISGPSRVMERISNQRGQEWLESIKLRHDIQSLRLFRVSPTPAYGITQALRRDQPDVTYAAALAAAKASISFARSKSPTVVFPLVVTDARIFTCSLRENDPTAIDLEEVTAGDLLWRNPVAQRRYSIIKIIGIEELDKFAATAYRSAMNLMAKTASERQGLSSSK
jgi:hypothetical protein